MRGAGAQRGAEGLAFNSVHSDYAVIRPENPAEEGCRGEGAYLSLRGGASAEVRAERAWTRPRATRSRRRRRIEEGRASRLCASGLRHHPSGPTIPAMGSPAGARELLMTFAVVDPIHEPVPVSAPSRHLTTMGGVEDRQDGIPARRALRRGEAACVFGAKSGAKHAWAETRLIGDDHLRDSRSGRQNPAGP